MKLIIANKVLFNIANRRWVEMGQFITNIDSVYKQRINIKLKNNDRHRCWLKLTTVI